MKRDAMTIKHFPEQQMQTQSVGTPSTMAEEDTRPPTPASPVHHHDSPPTSPENPTPPATEKVAFCEATVAFAVDISGSTQGPIIQAERSFVARVSSHLSPDAQAKARILPWDNIASPILPLESASSLQSRGGTDPRVLLRSSPHRGAIANSSLWFLMTDGLISPQVRISFAAQLAQARVHGTSCVTVIFGDPVSAFGGYGGCDISVGVGVYAVVPNCAFLFCNTRTGEVRLLQSKGVFTDALLKGREAPVFEQEKMDWELLPRVDLSDFTDVVLPKGGQKLGEQEIVLQDSLVVNLEDLYSNKYRADQVSKILANEDNVASIVMTAQTRGHAHVQQFQGWIQQQQMPAAPNTMGCLPRSFVNQQFTPAEVERLAQMQVQQQMRARERQELINRAMARSATTVTNAAALNSTRWHDSSSSSSNNNRDGTRLGSEAMGQAARASQARPQAPTQGLSLATSPNFQPGSEPGRVAGPGPLLQVAGGHATSATLQAEHNLDISKNGMVRVPGTLNEREVRAEGIENDPGSVAKLRFGVLRTPPGRLHMRASPISPDSRGTGASKRHSNSSSCS